MLEAKTKENKLQVKSILDVCTHVEVLDNGVHVCGHITFDQMRQIVEYLSQVLEEPVSENITTRPLTEQEAATLATINNQSKTINGLLGEVAQAKHDMERMKKENDANYQQAVGCLDAVKAMLELSQGNGATHRMRDFYGESIIKFIDSAKQKLTARHDADPLPF